MKPAEIVTVAAAIPMIVALIAAEVAESRTPAPSPAARVQASDLTPGAFDEIVVIAKRATRT